MKILDVPLYLCNIDHVCHKCKSFQFELGDVRLEQHVDLKQEHKIYTLYTSIIHQDDA